MLLSIWNWLFLISFVIWHSRGKITGPFNNKPHPNLSEGPGNTRSVSAAVTHLTLKCSVVQAFMALFSLLHPSPLVFPSPHTTTASMVWIENGAKTMACDTQSTSLCHSLKDYFKL